MQARLTNRTVKALKPKSRAYDVRDTEIKGFLIRVRPSANMTYLLQYRNDQGMQRHYRIGSVGTITPVQARDIAERKAAEVAGGQDIQADRKRTREENDAEIACFAAPMAGMDKGWASGYALMDELFVELQAENT